MNKLEFGKESQIQIIKKYQIDEIGKEKLLKEREGKPMKFYNVTIEVSGTLYLSIEAYTEEEAEEEAREDFEITEADWDIDYVRTEEAKTTKSK